MNKVYYGGAFDPIHKGHVQIAEHLLSFSDIDEVVISPCYMHTFNKKMVRGEHRIVMAEIATQDMVGVTVSHQEFEMKMSGSTYEYMNILTEQTPNDKWFIVIGQDNEKVIWLWSKGKELVNNFPFIIVDRVGVVATADSVFNYPPHSRLSANIDEISSTQVRKILQKPDFKGSLKYIDRKVLDYILEYNLYFS